MRMPILLVFLMLAACGRPLSPREQALMQPIMGDTFDPEPVRIAPLPFLGLVTRTYPTRPRVTCRERIVPPVETPTFETTTAGMVLFQRLFLNPDYDIRDFARGLPDRLYLPAAMFIAHEMTHVWQWQNRTLTGYSPLRVAREHAVREDPYLFDPADDRDFLDYGYEQQAALVEEYLCCAVLDPDGARTARLQRLLGQVMPVRPPAAFAGIEARLPEGGDDPATLCD